MISLSYQFYRPEILKRSNFWEINYCDITKLSVLQTRNLEKVQLVAFSLANGRKSHATHQKRELLIPFCNICLVSLKQLHCKGAHAVTFFFQSNEIVTLSIFPVIRENSFIFIHSVHQTPISTYIPSVCYWYEKYEKYSFQYSCVFSFPIFAAQATRFYVRLKSTI